METWTVVQHHRLKELNAPSDELEREFNDPVSRDRSFQRLETELIKIQRSCLQEFFQVRLNPGIFELEHRLTTALMAQGFARVATPIIMSKSHLSKMSITESHRLYKQIYWIDGKQCLRPMLAPHLYYIMKDLVRLCEKPIRFFEIGPCFRKETQGAMHSREFTMLNLVEIGLPPEERLNRLKELANVVARTAALHDFGFRVESSEVYGETVDLVGGSGEIEIGSGAMGPHPLDAAWGIRDTWIGFGFGLERLLMVSRGQESLGRSCRSLKYVDGISLRI